MSDQPDSRAAQIAALEAALRLPLPESTLAQIAQDLRVLREATAPTITSPHAERDVNIATQQTVNSTEGTVSNDGRIDGVAVGVNLGTIIYGRMPEEDERRRLVWYLDRLANKLYRMPLRGLEEKLDQGKGIALPQVYVMLAVGNVIEYYQGIDGFRLFEDDDPEKPIIRQFNPDWALPDLAIVDTFEDYKIPHSNWVLFRHLLVTEAVHQHQHLVLLGDPGGGKSTFLRHLAWVLAQRGLDQTSDATALFGWDDQRHLLPIILPLRKLAGRLAVEDTFDPTMYASLRDEIVSLGITQVEELLNEALHHGTALLLFDGLDEVPLDEVPGVSVDRMTALETVRLFAQLHPHARFVVTCRTHAFSEQLRAIAHWHVETIIPFTLGQVRHFIPAWYRELVQCGQLEQIQAERMGQQLLDIIIASPKLRSMAATPLLLTMMALVLYNKGELPRDRPRLYERILELLLGQWDKVRDGQSLAEVIGMPDWDSERVRPLLDQLSFQAHASATSTDGRGRIARRDVREALERFLIEAGMRVDHAAAAAVRCLDYFKETISKWGQLRRQGCRNVCAGHRGIPARESRP